eukprot:1584803-Karenia_brevis.AAC.1
MRTVDASMSGGAASSAERQTTAARTANKKLQRSLWESSEGIPGMQVEPSQIIIEDGSPAT